MSGKPVRKNAARGTQYAAEQSALAMGGQFANDVLPMRTVDDK
ncbi:MULTISPECIES: hypothetical protein [unclassified Janthinobacterium]|nr:hypothetical protein [Janthinobacterium sp. CG_23.4]MDH6156822.1 hypothetical protein [Janthinobacterium sp. CG_23.4]